MATLVLTLPVLPTAAVAATPLELWVDGGSASCSDSAPGTDVAPLCTIGAAAKRAVGAGDRVNVRPAVYREQVNVAGSGAAGAPIRFVATGPGTRLVGDRDLSDPAGWTAASGSAWSHPYDPPSRPRQVFVDGRRLVAAASASATTAWSFFYDAVGKVLHVDIGGSNPGQGHVVEAGAQTYGFNVVGRASVAIDGFETERQNNVGVRVSGSNGVDVTRLTARDAGINGVLVEQSSTMVRVASSTVTGSASSGIRVSQSSAVVVEDCTSHDNALHGIALSGATGAIAQHNESFANRAVTGTATAAGIDVNNGSLDSVVRGNSTHDNEDSGVQVGGGSHRALVIRNLSYRNDDHGFAALAATDTRYVMNTAYGNRNDGISLEGSSTRGTTSGNILVDNGLDTNGADLLVDATSVTGWSADHDLVWRSATAGAVAKVSGVPYRRLAELSTATGQETHATSADPVFADAASGDFSLRANSPAIDSTDSSVLGYEPADRTGIQPVDDVSIPDRGTGAVTYADRGALERRPEAGGPFQYAPHAALVLDRTSGAVPPSVPVVADASGSSDSDTSPIADYTFDFGDGTVVGPQTSPVASHAYTSSGTRQVTVTVGDTDGRIDTARVSVALTDRPTVTYTVSGASPSCSETGAGDAARPFCTISAAAAVALAGDTVLVQPAIYREQVTPRNGGMEGFPLVFRATGPGVRVLGTLDVSDSAGWSAGPGMAWSRAIDPASPTTQVFVDGNPLTAAGSATTTTSGSFFYDATTKVLSVDVGGGNPGLGHVVEAGSTTYGFKLWNTSDVVVEGFSVQGQNGSGISVQDSGGILLEGLDVSRAGTYGVQLDRVSESLVEGVVAHDNDSIGIRLNGSARVTVRKTTTHNNGFHGVSVQNSPDVVVSAVMSYRNDGGSSRSATGIDVSQGSTGVVVERSTTYANQDSGIEIYTDSADATVRRNVSYDNGDHGIDCFRSPGEKVVGNTVFANTTAGINLEGGCSGSLVTNNVSADNGLNSTRSVGDLRADEASSPGTTFDRNLLNLSAAGTVVEWNSANYTDLAAFQAATGQERHGIEADPRFVRPSDRDLRLTSRSPAIDMADAATPGWIATDQAGHAPVDQPAVADTGTGQPTFADLGALEYVGPVAILTISPASGSAPLSVVADGSGSVPLDGGLASYWFDCGNGTVRGPQGNSSAECRFDAVGAYTVTLRVTDALGLSDEVTRTVQVAAAQAPTASFTVSSQRGLAPMTVTVDASASSDPDVSSPIASYTFDCGNGTTIPTQPSAVATCSYPAAGTFTVTVRVTDTLGLSGSATQAVQVDTDLPPTVVLTVTPLSDFVPASVAVDASGSSDLDGTPIASYRITCGDGGPAMTTAKGTCLYPTVGTYAVIATVTDTAGNSASATRTVQVKADLAPTVTLLLSRPRSNVKRNQALTVDASLSTDPDKTPIASYVLNCGNGVILGPRASAVGTCTYTRTGTYTIRVTAVDTIGKLGSASVTITVK